MYHCTLNANGATVSFTYDSVEQLKSILDSIFASLSGVGSFLSNERAVSQPIVVFPSSSSSSSSDASSHVSSVAGHKNTRRNFKRRERRRRKKQLEQRDGALNETGQSGAIRKSVSRVLPETKSEKLSEPETLEKPSSSRLVPPPVWCKAAPSVPSRQSSFRPYNISVARLSEIRNDISKATDDELQQLMEKVRELGLDSNPNIIKREIEFRKNCYK